MTTVALGKRAAYCSRSALPYLRWGEFVWLANLLTSHSMVGSTSTARAWNNLNDEIDRSSDSPHYHHNQTGVFGKIKWNQAEKLQHMS